MDKRCRQIKNMSEKSSLLTLRMVKIQQKK